MHLKVLMSHRQRLIADVHHKSSMPIQAAQIQKFRTALLIQICKFTEAQRAFMPGLQSYLDSETEMSAGDTILEPEHMKLHLPSSIPTAHRLHICIPSLADIESCLHFAQVSEALTGLCWQLRTKMMVTKLSQRDASSQRSYTRSQTLRDQVEICVRTCQRQYNDAQSAVLSSHGPGDWEATLPVLKPEDVHGISE
jgi:hypothetical protein